MFGILFGWRKASKCKRLIKRVQCRLKLLKNKRSCIVRQMRNDVAELLKHGHDQLAFDRVEQLFRDECIAAVYDLLDHFCEFIIMNLPYIRKHKDCPNDINEAVSTLIFASARIGDLPELPMIRKLLGERYGQRYTTAALELLPGNLVNNQIQENLSMKEVSDDVKYRLLDEIARSCLQTGPLLLEYHGGTQEQQNREMYDEISASDVPNLHKKDENRKLLASVVTESEGKIVYVDISSESKKFKKDARQSSEEFSYSIPSPCVSPLQNICFRETGNSKDKKEMKLVESDKLSYPSKFPIPDSEATKNQVTAEYYHAVSGLKERVMKSESSPECFPPEIDDVVYLDDIQEFKSPMNKEKDFQDQRVFMFNPSVSIAREHQTDDDKAHIEKQCHCIQDENKRRSISSRKESGKQSRSRSISRENARVTTIEYEIYYGKLPESSQDFKRETASRGKYPKKATVRSRKTFLEKKGTRRSAPLVQDPRSSSFPVDKRSPMKSSCRISIDGEMSDCCSLEYPCYSCTNNEKDDLESPFYVQNIRFSTSKNIMGRHKERKINRGFRSCQLPCKLGRSHKQVGPKPQATERHSNTPLAGVSYADSSNLPKISMKTSESETEGRDWENKVNYASSISSSSGMTRKEIPPPYLRTMTMPTESSQDVPGDNISRSKSFPQPNDPGSNRHVHPKLPDYDEIAAMFLALKKEKLQSKLH